MRRKDDIMEKASLEDEILDLVLEQKKEHPSMDVPSGYFSSLEERLKTIPAVAPLGAKAPTEVPVPLFGREDEGRNVVRMPLWNRVKPYVSIAAAFLVMVAVGNSLLRLTTRGGATGEDAVDQLAYITGSTNPYYLYMQEDILDEAGDQDDLSIEDLEEYLISSGISVEHLSYMANNYEAR